MCQYKLGGMQLDEAFGGFAPILASTGRFLQVVSKGSSPKSCGCSMMEEAVQF